MLVAMRPRLVGTSLLLLAAGCSDLFGNGAERVPVTYAEQYDAFWDSFDRYYPYFEYKQVDWDSVRAATEAGALGQSSQIGFIVALRRAVQPLRDPHIWFEDATGYRMSGYNWPYQNYNYVEEFLAALAPLAGWTEKPQLRSGRLEDVVPYIAIRYWGNGFSVADFDGALGQFRNDTMLILDVRLNTGGDDALAYQVAARFTSTPVVAEYYQTRDGPLHSDLTGLQARLLQPRGPWAFMGRVALLTGPQTQSASESFVSAMRELPNVTVFGDKTGGHSGSPQPVRLGGGWKVWVPRVLYRTADSAIVEWNGIRPDFQVDWYVTTRDTIIAFTREWLRCPACVTVPGP
jgi:hypothetical protein